MPAAVLLALVLQTATPPSAAGGVAAPHPASTTRATAVRAAVPVVIDVRDDEEVWRIAQPITQFRVPLSQLRYVPRATNTFGFAVWRDIQRYSERVSWPVYRGSQAGISSQLGELTGLDGLPSPRRPEIAPYVVTKNVSVVSAGAFDRSQKVTGGADLKYGLTPSLTLDATINPDFGQVEADPAVLNLTAFETFFQERRPFFVQGAGTFRFDVNCSQVNCRSERLFYSRSNGCAPPLGDDDTDYPIGS